ncbi:3598_t:CDS:2, partial [Racocetra persica]
QIEYAVQLLPAIDKLSEEDLMKMDVIWKQFGFSHIEPETTSKNRQFNKQYCLYASGYQCSPPLITIDHVNQPFGSLSQLTFMLNWIT